MSRLPLVHIVPKHFCKAVSQVPGMETASPFTRFWRKREPIVAAAERANSRAHYGRRTWLKLNRASRSRRYRRKGPGVLLRAPPRSGLRITSRVKPPSRAVVGLTRRHLLQSQKLFIQGEPCGATSAMHRWDDLLPVHGPGCGETAPRLTLWSRICRPARSPPYRLARAAGRSICAGGSQDRLGKYYRSHR